MEWKITIYDFEQEFRSFVVQNSKSVSRVYVFEDSPDGMIFFYCFFRNRTIIATKEASKGNLGFYIGLYSGLASKFHFKLVTDGK